MTPITLASEAAMAKTYRPSSRVPPRCGAPKSRPRRPARARRICRYRDDHGRQRELVAQAGSKGSVLVIDRGFGVRSDERLLAPLAADEPRENADLMCLRYLEHDPGARACRLVAEHDMLVIPAEPDCWLDGGDLPGSSGRSDAGELEDSRTVEGRDSIFRLGPVRGRMAIPELRWSRIPRASANSAARPICLREAIAESESYVPFCAITRMALAVHRDDREVSITILRAELARILESAIVLNRGLREAVLQKVEQQKLSMSEVAIRCGRTKSDRRGNLSGETSWLARRLGLLPEGGQAKPTPWIHSDVLALIAREGIGVSPREVELG